MESDSVDRIIQAWRKRDPNLDSSTLEVTWRLLLCAAYYERAVGTVLERFGLSIADFDVLNTLRRVSDQRGCRPSAMARSSLITTGAMTSRLDRLNEPGSSAVHPIRPTGAGWSSVSPRKAASSPGRRLTN